jgi:hypothetical protein
VGITLNLAPVDGDEEAAARMDGHLNRWFLDPLLRGRYPADMLELYERRCGPLDFVKGGDLSLTAAPTDFLGVNYYAPMRVRADTSSNPLGVRQVPPGPPTTAMGWAVAPDGLRRVLVRVRDDYGEIPIAITENGASYDDPPAADGRVDDPDRTAYLESHLAALRRAVDEGVPVERYFVWSLLDNFEWEWGYDKRFGIVHVDFATQRRTPKGSGLWYRDYIERAASPYPAHPAEPDASGLYATECGMGSRASPASRLSTAMSAIRARVASVAEPRCGSTSRLGAPSSGWSPGSGSGSVTSSAAPAIRPAWRARTSASLSTIGPRAVLTR